MADVPISGSLTFLFADVEGSTGMLQRLGEGYQGLLGQVHRIINEVVATERGHVVSTEGDGFFCVFGSVVDAVNAAHTVAVEMIRAGWPGEERPRFRIGLHTGTATRTLEGYVGMDVHVAARIGAAAQGGQILVSTAVADLIREHVASAEWSVVDLGHYELKGIGHSERLHRLDIPGLPVVSIAPRARPRTPSTVPVAPRELVGRLDDVRGASEMLLRDGVRLVTLTGTGGTGKTRLAIELTRSLDDEFPDGTVFIDLSGVRDPERFLPVVGRALGVRESVERTIAEGLQAVIGEDRLLLVLDNMEQILDAAPQVTELLRAMPNIKVLVTSRSPLRIGWEHEYPLPPLSVPPGGADIEEIDTADAVVLFVERARTARPMFELNEVTRDVVADITRRLDGLPLALEIAAARLRLFTVEELHDRLDDMLGFTGKDSTDVPERHRTLRGAIKWSYDLLDDDEKTVFRRLSVFVGGWSLDASLQVCVDDRLSEARILDVLEELVAKSLVVFTIDESGTPRYRLLETLREFGIEELSSLGEGTEMRLRHLGWCRRLAERILEALPTPDFPP
ncbi:adenylate/guanylate cyclase domain-containing protein, partial [Serratia inhibens]|uniref:adenylate/guanylate cyclase domain-containing protein n=1 Tax=Serratia inhibens TaxID=2338073 RepID=UPI003C7B3CF3